MLRMMQEEIKRLEKETIRALAQLSELRQKFAEASGMDDFNNNMEVAQVPFAAYEMQLERHLEEKKEIEERHLKEKESIHDRHEREKDKMRKHYRSIILWIAIPFIAFIIGTFGTVAWFFANYDFSSYSQDGDGFNNMATQSTQGDVTYEPKAEDYSAQKS